MCVCVVRTANTRRGAINNVAAAHVAAVLAVEIASAGQQQNEHDPLRPETPVNTLSRHDHTVPFQ